MDGKVGLELAVGLEVARLVRGVLVDHVGAVVLEIPEGEEDDVPRDYPHLQAREGSDGEGGNEGWEGGTRLFPHLAADLGESRFPVLAFRLYPSVAQHLEHLCVF